MESTFNSPPHVNTPNSSTKRSVGTDSSSSSFSSTEFGDKTESLVNRVKNMDYDAQMKMIRDKASVAYDASAGVIKQNPILYVCGAAAVGFFAGMLFYRK